MCDSIFIDFVGVNHCISFDTVKVVLDSSFTPQVLRDSQAFCSSAFNFILVVIGIIVAIFVLAMTIAWNKRFDAEVAKIQNKASESVKIISDNSFKESKEEFDRKVYDLNDRLKKASSNIENLLSRIVLNYLLQAKSTEDVNDCLRYCIFAIESISSNFSEKLFTESDILVTLLEKKFLGIKYIELNSFLAKTIVEKLEIFESYYFEYYVDKSPEEKEKASNFVGRINAVKDCLEQYSKQSKQSN